MKFNQEVCDVCGKDITKHGVSIQGHHVVDGKESCFEVSGRPNGFWGKNGHIDYWQTICVDCSRTKAFIFDAKDGEHWIDVTTGKLVKVKKMEISEVD